MLTLWHNNQSSLEPLEGQSFLLQEVIPASQNLTRVAAAGLEALDYLDRGARPREGWKSETVALLEDGGKPRAQLLLVIVPSIEKLVEAAAGGSTASLSK